MSSRSKVTLSGWLASWLEKSVKPLRRPATYATYASLVATHINAAPLGGIRLQQLRASDIERFYAESKLAPASLGVVHALIHRALRKAVKDRLLIANPAIDLERKRVTKDAGQAARLHCWSAIEARRVLAAAEEASPQLAAYVFLALDAGARKSELDGLGWEHVDLDAGVVTIERQLDRARLVGSAVGAEPVFGPTKTKRTRVVMLGEETIARLKAHKKTQAELKMKNRTAYADFGLVFAKEPEDLQTPTAKLGQPLTTLSGRRFQAIAKAADCKRIKFHGARHTVATLSLAAGTPPHVVASRLGHSTLELLRTYAHALPDQQQDAATRLGRLLHG